MPNRVSSVTCIHCRDTSACPCANCIQTETTLKRYLITEDGEMFICPHCNFINIPDNSEDFSWREYRMIEPSESMLSSYKVFYEEKLPYGNVLEGSKKQYKELHPDNFVIYNASLISETEYLWYGDIDLTLDREKIQTIAKRLNINISLIKEDIREARLPINILLDKVFIKF